MVMAVRGIIRWQTPADESPPAKRIRTNIWNGIDDFHRSTLCKSVGDGNEKKETSVLSVAATECGTEYTPVGVSGHTVDCAHITPRCIRSQTPPFDDFDDFGFLPLGMMAKMIHSHGHGLEVLETDSDTGSESSDEEDK
jgi:hypothetical protein